MDNVSWQRGTNWLKHLKLTPHASPQDLNLMIHICRAIPHYPALKTLEIDLVFTKKTHGYSPYVPGTDPIACARQIYELSRRHCPTEEKKKKLKRITVTGLPSGLEGSVAVRLLSTILDSAGTIAIATAPTGYRYWLAGSEIQELWDPQLEEIGAGDIDRWAEEN